MIQKPNAEQSVTGDLSAVLRDTLNKWLRDSVDDMLPAKVISYSDETGLAVVQPIVQIGTTSGTKISRARIENIKTLRMGAGGFFMRWPIKPGDLGWIKANDRDISLILQASGGEDWPNTKRLHSFSDAIFIPDTFKSWVIDGSDIDALIIQSIDGSVKVALRPSELQLTAPTVKVDAPETIWNGNVTLTGNLEQTGNFSNTGTIQNNSTDIGSGHSHSGVEPGSGTSGPPV